MASWRIQIEAYPKDQAAADALKALLDLDLAAKDTVDDAERIPPQSLVAEDARWQVLADLKLASEADCLALQEKWKILSVEGTLKTHLCNHDEDPPRSCTDPAAQLQEFVLVASTGAEGV